VVTATIALLYTLWRLPREDSTRSTHA